MLFVYGTLRRSEPNHHYLSGAKLLADACYTPGVLMDTGFGYPAMLTSKEGHVYGELYLISDKQLADIDLLEDYHPGADSLYERIVQAVCTRQGTKDAYVYVYRHDISRMKPIPGGDWRAYREKTRK